MGFVIFAIVVALVCALGSNGEWSLNFWSLSLIVIIGICIWAIVWASTQNWDD